MTRRLKYVFYFESLLMAVTFVLGTLAPTQLLGQMGVADVSNPHLVALARWYGVPFFPLTFIQVAALRSGEVRLLKLVMLSYLLTDLLQMAVTLQWGLTLGWSQTHFVSLGTGIVFVICRYICLRNPLRIGVPLV